MRVLVCLTMIVLSVASLAGAVPIPHPVEETTWIEPTQAETISAPDVGYGLQQHQVPLPLARSIQGHLDGPSLPLLAPPGVAFPHVELMPSEWRLPSPVNDLDGDGTEDWALERSPLATTRDDDHAVVLSGDDGSELVTISMPAEWGMWGQTFIHDTQTFFTFYTCDTAYEAEYGAYTIEYCASTLHVFDAATFEPVWSLGLDATDAPDGSGYFEFGRLELAGTYGSGGLDAVLSTGRYAWTTDITQGVATQDRPVLVTLTDGQALTQLDTLGSPSARMAGDGHDDLLFLRDHAVERRDGADLSLMWRTDASALGFEPFRLEVVEHAGRHHVWVVSDSTETGAHAALINANGETVWNRFLPQFWRTFAPVGVSSGTGATLISMAHMAVDCAAETIYYRHGVHDTGSGEMLWVREGTFDVNDLDLLGLYFGVGDFDGDGAGDPMMSYGNRTSEAVIEVPSDCGAASHIFVLHGGIEGQATIHTSGQGEGLHKWDLDDIPGALILPHWHPSAPVGDGIGYFRARITTSTSWQVFYQEIFAGAWDLSTGDTQEVLVDARFMQPARLGGNAGFRWFPLDVHNGGTDQMLVSWYHNSPYGIDEHGRYGVYAIDVAGLGTVWQRESKSPGDVGTPPWFGPLPHTPLDG